MKPFTAVLTLSAILFGVYDLHVAGHVGDDAEWKAWPGDQADQDSNPPEIHNPPPHLHAHHPQNLLVATVPFEKFLKEEESENGQEPEFDSKMFFTVGELPVVPQTGRSHQEVVVADDVYEEPQTPQVTPSHAGEFGQFSFQDTKHTFKDAADVFTIEESELALGADRVTNVEESYFGNGGLQETIRSIHATIGSGGDAFHEAMGEGLEEAGLGVETLEEEAVDDDSGNKKVEDEINSDKESKPSEISEIATAKQQEEEYPNGDNHEPSVTLVK